MINVNQRFRQELKDMLQRNCDTLRNYIENLEDEEVEELVQFIRFIKKSHNTSRPIDLDTVKIFFTLMNCLSENDIKKILSYVDSNGYGWQDIKYQFSNSCLGDHATDHCKRMSPTSDKETAADQLECLQIIFFDKEYGSITLLIFCYCLVALFSKRLNRENFPVPLYLQIACDRHSVLFQLIEEIAEICDVNSGLINCCSTAARRTCEYRSQIYYPTQSITNDLDALMRENKDVPVIVDGYENLTYYNNLLRAVANITNSRTSIALRDKFNVLPLFVCPMIKSHFGNVLDMDLTDLDVSTEYLEYLRKNKQLLASHVLELIKNSSRYLFSGQNAVDVFLQIHSKSILRSIWISLENSIQV